MKKIVLLLLLTAQLEAQNIFQNLKTEGFNFKKLGISAGISFVGGAANGLHETIYHHYPQFKAKHPQANDQFWNPQESWKNKYQDWDAGLTGERYFGSKTFLAWTTDAKHLLSVTSNASMVGATLVITIGEKKKWWVYAAEVGVNALARSAGFHLVYSGIYKAKNN